MIHPSCFRFRIRSVLLMSAFLLFTVPAVAAAEDLVAVWVPESGDRAVFAAPDPSFAEPGAEAQRIGRDFYDFCSRWIGNKNGYSLQHMRSQTIDACRFKEYSQCMDTQEIRITKTPGSPVYVGTLKYIEKVFRAVEAPSAYGQEQSFVVAEERPVTEFFMYIDGQWCY